MKVLFPGTRTSSISIFIIWLFHICGVFGIAYGNKELFIAFTPINLFISFALLFVNQIEIEKKTLITVCGIFFLNGKSFFKVV